ncbi:aminoacyl-histidine dipeptidase [Sideroxydans lithotrophicus]|uniref:Cytosol non-specific dipeptidase n=1 Tax=Sideroxydans lithotrophicus (strain ES-1) TaxID=580332 RepID=D5CR86_SIDLE|nr:aminoacyl-histidine dipeptidase [Sideroxydans lithotrophicus]ADE11472.1 aminoacyl-histidine dipeptidase [Sideroxydans lithotrophicus ES-1]
MVATHVLANLQPIAVWAHFAALCAVPRSSLHEAALRQQLIEWAEAHGIKSLVDEAGNLILRKQASAGCEAAPGVILQGHLDMVCQANAGIKHDFERDPIKVQVHDGWVVAHDTTLGADNGIGVALALAALEEPGLVHPPLEVLLTVNEESGMDGARGLVPGTLQGATLINMDAEEWGHFYLGCAGGVDVEVRHACAQEALPPGYALWRLEVSGLRGGHSGIDIHLGRGNAIKLLADALHDLSEPFDLHLVEMSGGTARNAIPREACAVFAMPAADAGLLEAWVKDELEVWQEWFAESEDNISLVCRQIESTAVKAVAREDRDRLLEFLDSAANGVDRMSDDFPGVVDTSDNLGVVALRQGEFRATFKVRSLSDERADVLADRMISHAASYGLRAWTDGAYPGWTPNPSSDLLALCQQVYTKEFGQPASLQVIHAGLECGLLADSHPHLDMISFGPDIRGAHAPGERVEIESVAHCWALLKSILQALAAQPQGADASRAGKVSML